MNKNRHHQEVSTGHTDDADVGEGLEDVLQGGGGEGQDLLRRVGRDALQHRLRREEGGGAGRLELSEGLEGEPTEEGNQIR